MVSYKTLLDNVVKKKGYGRHFTESITNNVFMQIAEHLSNGDTVDVGDFGQFKPSAVKSHALSFNKDVVVPAHIKITFSNSDKLKRFINGEEETFDIKQKKPNQ